MYSKSVYLLEYYKKYTEHASGLQKPFYKAIFKQNKKSLQKKKRYRKRITCFICPKKRKKIKGTMPTCSTIKCSFFLFFNTKYKQRIHILKTELRNRHAVLETLQEKKAGVCLCLCRYIQRLGYVKIKYHKRPSHKSTNACCI